MCIKLNPVRLGIVGLGSFGTRMAQQIQSGEEGDGNLRVVALHDLDGLRTRSLAEDLKATPHPTLTALLSDPNVEAVAVFTEPVGRAELLRKIIRAGKDVMTTKPFETHSHAAQEILDEAESLGRMIHLNSPSPHPAHDIAQILAWQKEHQLGQALACRMEMTCSYRETADGTWYDDPERCPAAPFYRLGIYPLNDMTRFFGAPAQVHAFQSRIFTQRPTSDHVQVSILFQSGAMGSIFCSFCINDDNCYANRMILQFENGTVYRNCGPRDGHHEFNKSSLELQVPRASIEEPIRRYTFKTDDASGSYSWLPFAEAIRGVRPRFYTQAALVVPALKIIEEVKRQQSATHARAVNGRESSPVFMSGSSQRMAVTPLG